MWMGGGGVEKSPEFDFLIFQFLIIKITLEPFQIEIKYLVDRFSFSQPNQRKVGQ